MANSSKEPANESQLKTRFPIVGVGASAGGLEAFTQLLSKLDTDTGMAFVLLQHLDPQHESLSAEILSRATPMPVAEVKDGMKVQPNNVYIIPPNFSMRITHGILNLSPRSEIRGQHLVIDFFFQSLAEDQGNHSIGVVLSGTGADGTQGLIAIKEAGGITFAQDPKTAKFENMPQSAITCGAADMVLSPQKIASELIRIARHPYVIPKSIPIEEEASNDFSGLGGDSLKQIFLLLRNHCHLDFACYKSSTIKRRIERRMALLKIEDLKSYTNKLSSSAEEVKALCSDILIHVTKFFRDPGAFEELKTTVLPKLIAEYGSGSAIRIWVPGCSTGEEPYSIAICLLECLGDRASQVPIQIFATDVSDQAIQKARLGEYPESIKGDVSMGRLDRFFVGTDDGGYKIAKAIRDICVFSRHDVTADPPFARIDLLSCRNLLIYFTTELQKRVIPIFHYSLMPHSFLWLGNSEGIGGFTNLFSALDKSAKIYVRMSGPSVLNFNFPASTYVPGQQKIIRESRPFTKEPVDISLIADHALQIEYPGVLVNEALEILQFRGNTFPMIAPAPAPGPASHQLLKMAHSEIQSDLRRAIELAKKQDAPLRVDGLKFTHENLSKTFNLKVIPLSVYPLNSESTPLKPSPARERYYLLLFEDLTGVPKNPVAKRDRLGSTPEASSEKNSAQVNAHILELERELNATLDSQQSLIEKFENIQGDLMTANEELQSTNEELQSTNEELETAKEELQSGNEELSTVNDELQSRSLEQTQTNNDLINLLGSVQIPIVMLGNDRKIRRFTPLAAKSFNLISSDVGRPFSDLNMSLSAPGINLDVNQLISTVLEKKESSEMEVQDSQGHWYRLQLRPYVTIDSKIDGVVLALVDIDILKLSLQAVKAAKSEAERANGAKDLFLATLSHELRTPLTAILSWGQMLRTGQLSPEKINRAGEMIETCGKAQAALINDLLDVSRIIAGKLSLEVIELNPADIVSRAIETIRPNAEKKFIQIESYFDPRAGSVVADPARLQQVIVNLLSNAVKFSPETSRILVRMERQDDSPGPHAKVRISVSDSGKGINADFMPHIFDRFTQYNSSNTRLSGGLGLGLAIVKNLVEMQGGSVQAASPGENLGSTFTVWLPMESEPQFFNHQKIHEDFSISKVDYPDLGQLRLDGLRILIVDDQESAREAFSETLRALGAVILTAKTAEEGFTLFGSFKPDVLVSDIAMPEEDGYSLIRRIRLLSIEHRGNTPALALTAHAAREHIHEAISAGFQARLTKPVDGKHLARVILGLAGGTKHITGN